MEKRHESGLLKEKVVDLYQQLEMFLRSDHFGEDQRKILQITYPDLVRDLQGKRKEIETMENKVIIAGQRKTGKSTLINKILGARVMLVRNCMSPSTIIKMRNSENMMIRAQHNSGLTEMIDLTSYNNSDPQTKSQMLRKTLSDLMKRESICSIDVGYPSSFLKNNTALVEISTVHRGDIMKLTGNHTDIVSIIFVVNAARCERYNLEHTLRSLSFYLKENEFPWFDPKDVIFITNKWDCIDFLDDSEDDEDDCTEIWKVLNSNIKSHWPEVREENIYKMSLREVLYGKGNSSTEIFEGFKMSLNTNIEKAFILRVIRYLRFLQKILDIISKQLDVRCLLYEIQNQGETRETIADDSQTKVKKLIQECSQIGEAYRQRVQELENDRKTPVSRVSRFLNFFGKPKISRNTQVL